MIFEIYLYIVADIAVCLVIRRYLIIILRFILNPTGPIHEFFSEYIVLSFLLRRQRFWRSIIRFRAILILTQFAATVLYNIVGIYNLIEIQ